MIRPTHLIESHNHESRENPAMGNDPSILMKCPACGVVAKGRESYLTRKARCPKCKATVQFDRAPQTPKSTTKSKPLMPKPAPESSPPAPPAPSPPSPAPKDSAPKTVSDEKLPCHLDAVLFLLTGVGLVTLLLSPFFTWVQLGKGGVLGTGGAGRWLLAVSALAAAAFVASFFVPKSRRHALLAVQAWGTVALLWMASLIWRIGSLAGGSGSEGSPLGMLLALQVTPGTGLYLGLMGGAMVACSLGVVLVREMLGTGAIRWYYGTQGAALVLGILIATFGGVDRPDPEMDSGPLLKDFDPFEEPDRPEGAKKKKKPPKKPIPAEPEPQETIPELEVGDTVVVDEIRVTVRDIRIAPIRRKTGFDGSWSTSDEPYLLVKLLLENTSKGRIVHLQTIWEHTTMTDDFENAQSSEFSDGFSMYPIEGTAGSQKLRPGETVDDMMIFPLPVDAAETFRVTSDPRFWKPVGEGRIEELSNSSFALVFGRDEIKNK